MVSVEDDESWYGVMAPKVPSNCELILETDLAAYAGTIGRRGERFDVIVVDGGPRGHTRLKCSRAALEVWERPAPTEEPRVDCGGDVFGGVRRDERVVMASPSGPRQIRLIVSEAPSIGRRCVAIAEAARERVLLSATEPLDGPPLIEAQFEALVRLP